MKVHQNKAFLNTKSHNCKINLSLYTIMKTALPVGSCETSHVRLKFLLKFAFENAFWKCETSWKKRFAGNITILVNFFVFRTSSKCITYPLTRKVLELQLADAPSLDAPSASLYTRTVFRSRNTEWEEQVPGEDFSEGSLALRVLSSSPYAAFYLWPSSALTTVAHCLRLMATCVSSQHAFLAIDCR